MSRMVPPPGILPIAVALPLSAALGRIGPETDFLAARFLTERECCDCNRIAHPGRRRQSLAARIALKQLLLRDGRIVHPLAAEIVRNVWGRPGLRYGRSRQDVRATFCSLSHAGDRLLVAYATEPRGLVGIGVDLLPVSSRLPCHSRYVESPGDAGFAPEWSPAPRAALLWCLKEAAAKAVGGGFGSAFRQWVCAGEPGGSCTVRLSGTPWRARGTCRVHNGESIALLCVRNRRRPSMV